MHLSVTFCVFASTVHIEMSWMSPNQGTVLPHLPCKWCLRINLTAHSPRTWPAIHWNSCTFCDIWINTCWNPGTRAPVDSTPQGCYTVSLGDQFLTFWRVTASPSPFKTPRTAYPAVQWHSPEHSICCNTTARTSNLSNVSCSWKLFSQPSISGTKVHYHHQNCLHFDLNTS